jgi:hypothetical protein
MERIGNGVPQDQEAVPVTTTLQERQRSEDGEETSTNSKKIILLFSKIILSL